MKWQAKPYQQHAVTHILQHPGAGLLLDMGLGKTAVTGTAIGKLLQTGEIRRILVIAPKRVAETVWDAEFEKWDHLQHLRTSKILGDASARKRALSATAEVYLINRENIPWLVAHYGGAWPFDMVVVDESSSFKSPKSKRFKALQQKLGQVKRLVILTGTPTPNGLLDLWAQVYLLDRGLRLGKSMSAYRSQYFVTDKRVSQEVYTYKLNDTKKDTLLGEGYYEREIYSKISDICISMKSEDYLDLPGRMEHVVKVKLSGPQRTQYYDLERDAVLRYAGGEIDAVNAAALSGKLLQFAGGAVYNDPVARTFATFHDAKLEALEELVEAANGKPVIVAYWFKHEKERIMQRLKPYGPVDVQDKDAVERWNRGEIPVMLLHPASAGHGLNLQDGGHLMIWFGSTWSSELYQQANKRLDRPGQKNVVQLYRLIAEGTIDEDTVAVLDGKIEGQEALLQAVKARVAKYVN